MSNARNLARVVADTSGAIAATNLANAVPADGSISTAKLANGAVALSSKVSGVLPDANAPSGSIVQIVQATITAQVTTSSTSDQATGLIATITPSNASNKILVLLNGGCADYATSGNMIVNLYRNINGAGYSLVETMERMAIGAPTWSNPHSYSRLDSPNTTSSISYQPYFNAQSGTMHFNNGYGIAVRLTLLEIAA